MLSFSPQRRRHRAGAASGVQLSGGSLLAGDADRKIFRNNVFTFPKLRA
jgi:hypothetical protein